MPKNRTYGMTLVELIIAMSLSLFVINIVAIIYVATHKNSQIQIALNTIQENARQSEKLLRNEIQTAGLIGCPKLSDDFNLPSYNPTNRLWGAENTITIRKASIQRANLIRKMTNHRLIWATATPSLVSNRYALISDCSHAEIFKIDHVTVLHSKMQEIYTLKPLHYLYHKNAAVSLFETNTFYVKPTHRKSISALFIQDINQRDTELIEGVDSLQFKYDVKDNNQLKMLSAKQVTDWSKVVGVNIELMLSGLNEENILKPRYIYIALREV